MKICFPHPPGHGGPGSFQSRFEKALNRAGWTITYAEETPTDLDVIMIVGGTKRLIWLRKMKSAGIPIVYRLDGINWLHRKKTVALKNFLLAESRNLLSKIIHTFIADHIVYQSQFVHDWWEKAAWKKPAMYSIIGNGVDLKAFKPLPEFEGGIKLLCLEGNIDYSPYAVELINDLSLALKDKMPVVVHGKFEKQANLEKLDSSIDYRGPIERSELPKAYRNTIYLSLDVNAACPNTVVEALASGAPVVGFDTGALKELVGEEAGIIVSYGSDPWLLEPPGIEALREAIHQVAANYDHFAKAARQRAEKLFDIDMVFDQYMVVIRKMMSDAKSNE